MNDKVKKEKAPTLESVKAAADAIEEPIEQEVEVPTPEDMVRVKSVVKVNVFASTGKIKPGEEAFVTEDDAKALKENEYCIEV